MFHLLTKEEKRKRIGSLRLKREQLQTGRKTKVKRKVKVPEGLDAEQQKVFRSMPGKIRQKFI